MALQVVGKIVLKSSDCRAGVLKTIAVETTDCHATLRFISNEIKKITLSEFETQTGLGCLERQRLFTLLPNKFRLP